MIDYRQLCIELFGTDDVEKLKKIANKKKSGRKKSLTKAQIDKAIIMQQQGEITQNIATKFGVSRQTLSKYINKAFDGYDVRLDFMHKQKVCTKIYVDYKNQQIKIINVTNNILHRAFGVNEAPTWEDYNEFLEERCFPKSRAFSKTLIDELEVTSGYDPFEIILKTKGRMAEDNQYINITYLN
ncbi:MAG: helix-turn-helix domain-containing protein [Acutalibacteraceae bacterium]|nr:helix-turn-helix domain-containing protein [Acutalibacteraceae bacterium]